MQPVVTGLSHKTAPLELRERIALAGQPLRDTLLALTAAAPFSECAVLSTCNRSEFYAIPTGEAWQERLLHFLAEHAGVSPGQLQEHLYSFAGPPAVRHLFRVAAGLDSMVVGEGQVLGQVKTALQEAQAAGTAGALLNGLFQAALVTGKRARSETEINRGAVSVSLAAVQLARQIFGRLAGHAVLILGAGEYSEQTARLLLNDGVAPRIMVANRTPERANTLAEQIGGTVIAYEEFPEALARADIVISSTGAPHPIVRREAVQRAMRARRGRPMFLIDIAVPRDVEPAVGDLDDVFLYNIDDLQDVVARGLQARGSEVQKVETIVEEEVVRFQAWLRGREVAPTISELQQHAETLVTSELQRANGLLAGLPDGQREAVEGLARRIARRLLREPIVHLKEAAHHGDGYEEVNAVRAVFRLDRETEEEPGR